MKFSEWLRVKEQQAQETTDTGDVAHFTSRIGIGTPPPDDLEKKKKYGKEKNNKKNL